MTYQRDSEDILNPERVFYRLVKDYADGKLTYRRQFLRAIVIASAKVPGELESNPPCPVGSIRARIYTHGMDANIPNDALSIFYPMFPGDIPQPGEHVYVVFEDENFSSGLWVSRIPNYTDVNLANPDENPQTSNRDAANSFEGTSPSARIPTEAQYRAVPILSEQQETTVLSFEEQENGFWENKRVLIIGDSMMEGPPGAFIEREIKNRGGAVERDGRAAWGVSDWLRGRGPRTGPTGGPRARSGPKLNELIIEHNPDIVLIGLGGNDWDDSRNEQAYSELVSTLWEQAAGVETRLWIGPPSTPNPYPQRWNRETQDRFNVGRERAGRVIQNTVGASSFIDVSSETDTEQGRAEDGIHFVRNGVPRSYILKVVNR